MVVFLSPQYWPSNIKYRIKNLRTKKTTKVRGTFRDLVLSVEYAFFIIPTFSDREIIVDDIITIIPKFNGKYAFAQVKYINKYSSLLSAQGFTDEKLINPKLNSLYAVLKLIFLDNLQVVEKIHNAKTKVSKKSKKQK
jgi:hypothetical protein